jgi:hypothetical protein
MKRVILALGAVLTGVLLTSVSFRDKVATAPVKKYSPSCGYTLIEYGIGIDCNGDTVKISKQNDVQALSYN